MSYKLKSLVVFLKFITNLLLLRNFAYDFVIYVFNSRVYVLESAFRID